MFHFQKCLFKCLLARSDSVHKHFLLLALNSTWNQQFSIYLRTFIEIKEMDGEVSTPQITMLKDDNQNNIFMIFYSIWIAEGKKKKIWALIQMSGLWSQGV